MESVDLVVIGAGWHGIVTAKTYLELHPTASVVVLEAAQTLGGTWAQHRLYPGLITNNMIGMYHYPGYPQDEAIYGVKHGSHIPGRVIHDYLTAYAKKFGVFARIRFDCKVETVESYQNNYWLLSIASSHDKKQMVAKKLVVATGLTSEPNMPVIPGSDAFQGPIVHAREALTQTNTVETAESIVVIGSGKSAWDVAYAHATRGITVDMVIRESGKGPVWISPPYVTPLKKWLEKIVTTRFMTWFSPCTWGDSDGYGGIRSILHGTATGRFLVNQLWNVINNDVISLNGHNDSPELKKLQPWHPIYYEGGQLSINNYPTDCFELVKQSKIRPHIGDVTNITEHSVHLSNGETLKADAIICATGWKHKPTIQFLGIPDQDLGLPHSSSRSGQQSKQAQTQTETDTLVNQANNEILTRVPSLKTPPNIPAPEGPDNEPYRLHRFLVPPAYYTAHNIAFIGMQLTTMTSTIAAIQALWVSAYFDNALDIDNQNHNNNKHDSHDNNKTENNNDNNDKGDSAAIAKMQYETILHTQALKWRYPMGQASKHPDFVFDAVPYVDLLMGDLGLQRWRKGKHDNASGSSSSSSSWWSWSWSWFPPSWLREVTEPYTPDDYAGVVDEWKEGHVWG